METAIQTELALMCKLCLLPVDIQPLMSIVLCIFYPPTQSRSRSSTRVSGSDVSTVCFC